MSGIKLYLGCGPLPIHRQHLKLIGPDWILSDKYVDDPAIKKIDAVNLWAFEDESVDEIYHSHLMEHLSFKEVRQAMKEWHRVLKKGGRMRINVPDMEWAAMRIINHKIGKIFDDINNKIGGPLNEYFSKQSPVFDTQKKLMEVIYGNQDHEGEFHKSGYTKESLENLLEEFGYEYNVKQVYEAHEMGVLFATAIKK